MKIVNNRAPLLETNSKGSNENGCFMDDHVLKFMLSEQS